MLFFMLKLRGDLRKKLRQIRGGHLRHNFRGLSVVVLSGAARFLSNFPQSVHESVRNNARILLKMALVGH